MAADLKRELKVKKADLMTKLADMPDSQLQARSRACAWDRTSTSARCARAFGLGTACVCTVGDAQWQHEGLQKPRLAQRYIQLPRMACADQVGTGQPHFRLPVKEIRSS